MTKETPRKKWKKELVELGEKVRESRQRAGLTQADLAEVVDLSVAYLSLIERGGRNPPYTTLLTIARALQVPVARIVPSP
jgi:transcriptional regulator with XRE-family HTH domain